MSAFAKEERAWAAAASVDESLRGRGKPGASMTLEGVTFAYDGTQAALAEASLHIEAGEFVSLVGPSGSGKSTILNLVAGLLKPTRGRVLESGREVNGPGPDRTVVFQDAALFPWLTLRHNVEFPLKM